MEQKITDRASYENIKDNFLNEKTLYAAVTKLVEEKDMSYIEATTKFCEDHGVCIEELNDLKLIVPSLKTKLYEEGIISGQLKKSKKITFEDM
jgi:hypothetical protein